MLSYGGRNDKRQAGSHLTPVLGASKNASLAGKIYKTVGMKATRILNACNIGGVLRLPRTSD